MIYLVAAQMLLQVVTVVGFLWFLNQERTRHQTATGMLQRQLMALVDKVAVTVADTPAEFPVGKVTVIDEAREVELDAQRP